MPDAIWGTHSCSGRPPEVYDCVTKMQLYKRAYSRILHKPLSSAFMLKRRSRYWGPKLSSDMMPPRQS